MSLQKISMKEITSGNASAFLNEDIILFDNFLSVRDLPSEIVVTEGYFFCIIRHGSLTTKIEGKEYSLSEGDIFTCSPKNILQKGTVSEDIDAIAIFISPSYASNIADILNLDWTFRTFVSTHEILHCNEEEIGRISTLFSIVQQKINSSLPSAHRRKMVSAMMVAMALELSDNHFRTTQNHPVTVSYSATEMHMHNFLKMLSDDKVILRSVEEYAQRLNVTPKYFSAICKEYSGKTASALINEAVMKNARIMLHDHKLSIKEISESLGFTNQSHFGSFFRRNAGISPMAFRDSLKHKR